MELEMVSSRSMMIGWYFPPLEKPKKSLK